MGKKQISGVVIRKAEKTDIALLQGMAEAMKQVKEPDYFALQFDYAEQDGRLVFIAEAEGRDVAYCIFNWKPKYGYFRIHDIPEIQDLNVLPEYRRRGVATQMIAHCEALARKKKCPLIGIGVAVHSVSGPAQKLYASLGYIPDGFGVTYDRATVASGEFRPVDDQLCLMMVKEL